jgi:DNA-binding NarL/FixJ family response regulator
MSTKLIILAPFNLPRLAWQALLETQPGITVAGTISDLSEINPSQLKQPASILVDIPAVQARSVSQLHDALPDFGLLYLVDQYDLDEIVALLGTGATGFIKRDASVGDLARAIIATGRGEIILPSELATQALVALARREGSQITPQIALTEREQQVLELLAKGLSNKDIAQTLILSVRTVEAHLRNIYGKLDVGTRTEAVLWAVNQGFGLNANEANI